MVQLSGFGKPKTIKVKRTFTRNHRENINNFEKRKELEPKTFNKTFKKHFNKLISESSLNMEELQEMKTPTLIDHIYGCIEKSEQSFADVEALLAFSSIAGFDVPANALFAFKLSRAALKLAKTRKVKFVDAVIDGIALAVPAARLSGYTKYSALDRGARVFQMGLKKVIKGESIKPANALLAYSSIVPSLTSRKIGASVAGSLARQHAAMNGYFHFPKSNKKT
jgi:hypothetical protein